MIFFSKIRRKICGATPAEMLVDLQADYDMLMKLLSTRDDHLKKFYDAYKLIPEDDKHSRRVFLEIIQRNEKKYSAMESTMAQIAIHLSIIRATIQASDSLL